MLWVILLFTLLLIIHFYPRYEPYENYDETTCLSLAAKNKENLKSLQSDVDKLLLLQSQVKSIQGATDANTNQLKSLVDQVYKTPPVTSID